MKKAQTQKNTLLQAASSQHTNQSLQESIFFSSPRRIFHFFSPTLRCINFFAIAQPTTNKHSDNLLQTLTGQRNMTQMTEARTANSGGRSSFGGQVHNLPSETDFWL
jgi:hypothetical protein